MLGYNKNMDMEDRKMKKGMTSLDAWHWYQVEVGVCPFMPSSQESLAYAKKRDAAWQRFNERIKAAVGDWYVLTKAVYRGPLNPMEGCY